MAKTKVTTKGQITIPQEFREKLGISRGTLVNIKMEKEKIVVEKPKGSLMELGGSMPWFSKELEEDINRLWKRWKI